MPVIGIPGVRQTATPPRHTHAGVIEPYPPRRHVNPNVPAKSELEIAKEKADETLTQATAARDTAMRLADEAHDAHERYRDLADQAEAEKVKDETTEPPSNAGTISLRGVAPTFGEEEGEPTTSSHKRHGKHGK